MAQAQKPDLVFQRNERVHVFRWGSQFSRPLTALQSTSLNKRCIVRAECNGASAETRFGLPAKRTSPCISVGESVQSTAGCLAEHFTKQALYYRKQVRMSV